MAILAGGRYSSRPKTMTQQYMEEVAQKKRKIGRKPKVEQNATVIELRLQGFINREISLIVEMSEDYVSKIFNKWAHENYIDDDAIKRNQLNREMAIYTAYVKYQDVELVASMLRSTEKRVLKVFKSVKRELEIVKLKEAGVHNRKIAGQLHCSIGTIYEMIIRNKLRGTLNENAGVH